MPWQSAGRNGRSGRPRSRTSLSRTRLPVRGDGSGFGVHLSRSRSSVRGSGWGTRLVALGIDLSRADKPVHFCAEVKPDNKVSRSIFLRLGFVEEEDGGQVFYYDNLR